MRWSYLRAILIAPFLLDLTACSSVLVLPANMQVVPTQYHLSPADVYAIQRLPAAMGIKADLHSITPRAHDEVQIDCGDPYVRDARMLRFSARRKSGLWIAVRSSLSTYRPDVTD